MSTDALEIPHQPEFPTHYQPSIGIIGCGKIVQNAHLPAYQKYGLHVAGAYDISEQARQAVYEKFAVTPYSSVDELLANPEIEVVDIATHPGVRADLILQALRAGKHVLSQKPLALDMQTAHLLVEEAAQRNLKLAVNQNGRYSPAWRVATKLVEQGTIGEVLAVTHLFEMNFHFTVNTAFDDIPHLAIYDYAIHWIDSIRCWMPETHMKAVRAREYRTPNQPAESKANWGCWVEFEYDNGAHAMIRGVNCLPVHKGHPFWIHGTLGTVRGSALGSDFVELEKDGATTPIKLEGSWFPDGMGGTIAELLSAIAEDREPYNSARHNLRSLAMTLAACKSAEADGLPVTLEEVQ